jgi:integrase
MNYPQKEGKHGPIYQVAEGISVTPNEWGSWLVILRRGSDRKKKSFGKTPEDQQRAIKAAELLAARMGLILEKQMDTGRTFGRAAQEWYELNAGRWRPGTKERYECIIRKHLLPLELLPLEKVDKAQVKRLLADLLQIRSPKTVEVTHAVISGIFTEANELGYTQSNPAHGLLKRILPAKRKRVRNEPDPLNRQDLGSFLGVAWAKLPMPYPLVLEVMAMAGLRLGEALAISTENLDIRNGQYYVTETTRAGRFGPPKCGKRLIDLDETLVGKLEAHIKKMRKEALAGGTVPRGYLFPGTTQRMIQRAMQRACRAARLRVRNPHDLRHSYATLLLMDHYSPAYVQKQLGHSSISITVDIYGHWIPGEGKKDLTKTLRGPEALPGRTLSLATGADSPQWPQ